MLTPALVTSRAVPFLPEFTGFVDLLLGSVTFGGQRPFLVKKWAIAATLTCSLEEIVTNSFRTRRSRLTGRMGLASTGLPRPPLPEGLAVRPGDFDAAAPYLSPWERAIRSLFSAWSTVLSGSPLGICRCAVRYLREHDRKSRGHISDA